MSTYRPSETFDEAAQYLSSAPSLAKVSNNVKLELYGLFKSITVSTVPNTSCPSIFDMTGRAKWNSWQSIGKSYADRLPEAENRYLELAREFGWKEGSPTTGTRPSLPSDVDDIWDKDTDSQKSSGGGMGNFVSTMSQDDQYEREGTAHGIVVTGDVESLRRYLEAHPTLDLNAADQYGYTLLHLACDRGHVSIVKFLLDRGVDTSIKDPDELTAIELAQVAEHDDIVQLLQKVS